MYRITFDEKVKLTEKVKRLQPEGLSQFVKMVEELCPKAKSDLDAKRLQIKVDDLDKATFAKLTVLLDSQLGKEEDLREPPNKKPKVK